MKLIASLVLASSAVLSSGCAAIGRSARVDPAIVAIRSPQAKTNSVCAINAAPKEGDRPLAINIDCFKFSEKDERTAYQMATLRAADGKFDGKLNKEDAKGFRNQLGFVLLNQANFICEIEKGNFYGNRAAVNGILDLAASGFSITSSIVAGEKAKSILSGISAFSTGARTNIDANVYQNQLVSAITKVLDAERASILANIRSKQSQSIDTFGADEMIFLANEYHQACSFQKGVQLLLDAAINKQGRDQIVAAINLRQTIEELGRYIEKLEKSPGFDKDDPEYKALVQVRNQAALKLVQNGQISNTVTTTPAEQPATPPAPVDES